MMSDFKAQPPVIHIPSIKKWRIPYTDVDRAIKELGLELLYPRGVHDWYYYTDADGVAAALPHLIQKSTLFKPSRFTCINYAFKVWNLASELYGLNTWVPVIGKLKDYEPRHAWILIIRGNKDGLVKEEFTYFEPNDGWVMSEDLETAYQAFPIGEEGYMGEFVFY